MDRSRRGRGEEIVLPVDMSSDESGGDDVFRGMKVKVKDCALVREGIGLEDVLSRLVPMECQ